MIDRLVSEVYYQDTLEMDELKFSYYFLWSDQIEFPNFHQNEGIIVKGGICEFKGRVLLFLCLF